MEGDASTRIYERLVVEEQTVVLMNAPRRPDGPPVRDGKPLQRNRCISPRISLLMWRWRRVLRDRNLSAPAILQADLDDGLIIMEDLGNERIVEGNPPAPIERATRSPSISWRPASQPVARPASGRAARDYRLPLTTWTLC